MRVGPTAVQEPRLRGQRKPVAAGWLGRSGRALTRCQVAGHLAQAAVLEHILRHQVQAGLASLGHQLHGKDAVAPEGKEIVIGGDRTCEQLRQEVA